jgi:hypothetical protein
MRPALEMLARYKLLFPKEPPSPPPMNMPVLGESTEALKERVLRLLKVV